MRLLSASLCLFVPLASGQSDETLYAIPTTTADWDFCGLEYSEKCPATISIEQSACEAPLIVNGRVLQSVNGQTTEDTAVQIQVDYRSEYFGSIDRKSVQKWGAGLNNTEGVFANSSGFFTTWVTGFNDTPTDLAPVGVGSTPCGTRSPQSGETWFFFLQALPENEGKQVEIMDDGSLNVNFSLSTSELQSGVVQDTAEIYSLIEAGSFSDFVQLNGNCEPVYCCYNPSCEKCAGVLEKVKADFTCDSTYAPKGGTTQSTGGTGASAAPLLTWSVALIFSTTLTAMALNAN